MSYLGNITGRTVSFLTKPGAAQRFRAHMRMYKNRTRTAGQGRRLRDSK